MEDIRRHYLPDRVKAVDSDFLEFEEETLSTEDSKLIQNLLCTIGREDIKFGNPHNSIILWLTGLTDQFDLYKGRSDTVGGSSPDIDCDFSAADRDKLWDWLAEHWGRENIANVITHGTFGPKSLAARYFGTTEQPEADKALLMKMIPPKKFGFEANLDEIVKQHPDLPEKFPGYYALGKVLEDTIQGASIHAGGVVISSFPISDVIPIWKNSTAERITQFDKDEIEELGLLKFDCLAVDTFGILSEAMHLIRKNKEIEIDPYHIPDGDEVTYSMLHQGLLTGVFQLETSPAAKDLVMKIKPTSILHLSDINAINRPGPNQAGIDAQYIENMESGCVPEGMPLAVQEILKDTHYVFIYQETVMKIFSDIAGFSMRESDDIRRAIGKKKRELMESYKEKFITRCAERGLITTTYAEALWEDIVGFSEYGFNKSHSVSYSIVTYATAWLKANYTEEFFCALMTTRSKTLQPKDWRSKAPEYIREARAFGLEISQPNINRSGIGFVINDHRIYFGLNAIRQIGHQAATSIAASRMGGSAANPQYRPYKDVRDFLSRVSLQKVNTQTFTSLVNAGAFDCLGYERRDLLDNIESMYAYMHGIVEYAEREREQKIRIKENLEKQPLVERKEELRRLLKLKRIEDIQRIEYEKELDSLNQQDIRKKPLLKLGEPPVFPQIEQKTKLSLSVQELMLQADYVGCYIGTHPAELVRKGCASITNIMAGENVNICGIINSVKQVRTKKGQTMAFVGLDDGTAIADVTIFPMIWKKFSEGDIVPGALVRMRAKVEQDEPLKLIAQTINVYKEI